MSFQDQIKALFVEESQIPEEFRIKEVHQREYLSNGELKQWTGEVSEVYSPICISTPEGLKRKLIGTYPIGTDKEANEALDAAIAAYDNGRGEWPTMSVEGRIKCMHNFVLRWSNNVMWSSNSSCGRLENPRRMLLKNLTVP